MTRTAGLYRVLALLTCWLAAASAHEDQAFHLAGASFCVDPASVQVALNLPNPEREASAQKVLQRDLGVMLKAALSRSEVAHEVRERCTGARDYTLLVADVRYLDPKTYIGFGEGAHSYTLFLQIGRFLQIGSYADASSGQLSLPANAYNASLSDVYAEGDEGKRFEPFVVGEGSRLVQGLTAYWWEDNPRRSLRSTLLPPLLGGALALVSGVTAWWALRRRGRGLKPRHDPGG